MRASGDKLDKGLPKASVQPSGPHASTGVAIAHGQGLMSHDPGVVVHTMESKSYYY